MIPLLGCIADDFTGATDLASTLVSQGMKTIQFLGIPPADTPLPEADAIVIALKIRSLPKDEAIAQALAAYQWLSETAQCRQFLWKYCSTFDSTSEGNIGPVGEALLSASGDDLTIYCPAFPENGRTIYKGHLFVGDSRLDESGMRHHPLTPMLDSSLVRLLTPQISSDVGLVTWETVNQGVEAIRAALQSFAKNKTRAVVIDALTENDLITIGTACRDLKLITGGSGIALGLPANFRANGDLPETQNAAQLPQTSTKAMILAGSCSPATREQICNAEKRGMPTFRLDALELAKGPAHLKAATEWAIAQSEKGPGLIFASADPEQVEAVHAALGRDLSGQMVEKALAHLAKSLHTAGVRRFVIAGGETSGAVVQALDVTAVHIGAQIAPGVPWTVSFGDDPVALALKSGNFGGENFLHDALEALK